MRLTNAYPYRPYLSGYPYDGDSKSEENAWEAYALAAISQAYPNHPHAALWEAKARELAKYSIVRPVDNLFLDGEQVVTVENDFTVTNHNLRGNPYYQFAAGALLRKGAQAYVLAGKEVPPEFESNVAGLYGRYKAECMKDENGRWMWTEPADPVGDPTVMPVAGMGDGAFERDIVRQKAADGYLWLPTEPVTGKLVVDPEKGLKPGTSLGTAIQNGKVLWYYLTDSYLWHFPPTPSNPR